MAAALVLGEWIGQYGLQTGILASIFMMLAMILLWNQKGRIRYCLPFFCCLGAVLVTEASVPTEFETCLNAYLQETATEEKSQGITGTLTGIIEDVEPDGEGVRLYVRDCFAAGEGLLESASIRKVDGASAGKVMITCGEVEFGTQALTYAPGSRIVAEGWMYLFPKATNPGQFDTANYYLGINVRAGMKADTVRVVTESSNWLRTMLLKWEMELYASLEQVCDARDTGVFQAVLLGASRQVDEETKALYQAGGIAHLLSISGLHISCIAMVIYQVIRRCSGSFPVGMAAGVCFLVCYGIIVGTKASAIRAMLMFACLMGANVTGRKYDLLSAAGLAAILILVQYPMQIYQTGFWMSFLAVAGIGSVYPVVLKFTDCRSKWGQSLLFSASVQVSVLPVVLYGSYVCPVYGVLLNLLVVPLAAYLLFSAAGGAVGGLFATGAGVFLAGTGHFILNWYDWLCTRMLELPGASQITGQPALWQIFLYYSMLLAAVYLMQVIGKKKKLPVVLLLPKLELRPGRLGLSRWKPYQEELLSGKEKSRIRRQKGLRLLCIPAGILLLYGMLQQRPDGKLHITMLDVGQGECIHLQMPEGGNLLIDGGSTDVSSPGVYRIEPYLLSQGVSQIDLLVVTHPDADHSNGILELLESGMIAIRELYLAPMQEADAWNELLLLAEERGIPVRYACAGDCFMVSGAEITCLHPTRTVADENDNSVVLRLEYGSFSALFTGDISMEAEDFLTELEPVTLLKVPHHGSKYSASSSLLETCSPQAAFISCGMGNRYGHPHPDLRKRLEDAGCSICITKYSGALLLETDGSQVRIETFRENVYF